MHVLDLNVISANGARALAIFLANVTVPNEANHRLGERCAMRSSVASLRHDFLKLYS